MGHHGNVLAHGEHTWVNELERRLVDVSRSVAGITYTLVVLVQDLGGDDLLVLEQSLEREGDVAELGRRGGQSAADHVSARAIRTCALSTPIMRRVSIQFADVVAIHSKACTGE